MNIQAITTADVANFWLVITGLLMGAFSVSKQSSTCCFFVYRLVGHAFVNTFFTGWTPIPVFRCLAAGLFTSGLLVVRSVAPA